MNRRDFMTSSGFVGLGIAFGSLARGEPAQPTTTNLRGSFSTNDNRISIYTPAQVKPTRIFHITDTHLSMDDERGAKYVEFSARMAHAYQHNAHFQTGETYSARESFEQTLKLAKKQKVDFLAFDSVGRPHASSHH